MFNQWINRFTAASDSTSPADAIDLNRVCTVLLVEVARADNEMDDAEIQAMVSALRSTSNLEEQELNELVASCLAEADHSISLHKHIRLINESFSHEQKVQLIEQMWRVAFADGNLNRYEEYTIRKTCDLLYLKHRDFMQAKLKIVG